MVLIQGIGALLPLRFGLQLLQLTVTILLAASNIDNVQVAISPDSPQVEGEKFIKGYSVILALSVLTILGTIFELLSMTKGPTLLRNSCNLISIVCHFFGFFSTLWFMLSSWTYVAYIYIYLFFSLPPTIMELSFLLIVFYRELSKLLVKADPRKWEWPGELLICCDSILQYCWRQTFGLCNQPAPYV